MSLHAHSLSESTKARLLLVVLCIGWGTAWVTMRMALDEIPPFSMRVATLSLGAGYRLEISPTSEFTYEPRYLLPFADTGDWKFDQDVALKVGLNSFLSLKVSHTLRYTAEPPEGFEKTDRILAVSIVAKMKRP